MQLIIFMKNPPQRYGVSTAIRAHSVTCHPRQANTPRLNPRQASWYSIYLLRWDGRLSWQSNPSKYWPGPTYSNYIDQNQRTTAKPSHHQLGRADLRMGSSSNCLTHSRSFQRIFPANHKTQQHKNLNNDTGNYWHVHKLNQIKIKPGLGAFLHHLTRNALRGTSTLCPKKRDYIFYNNFNNRCPITIIFGIVSSKSMSHQKMVSFPTSPI